MEKLAKLASCRPNVCSTVIVKERAEAGISQVLWRTDALITVETSPSS
jgi:hypothetical protein